MQEREGRIRKESQGLGWDMNTKRQSQHKPQPQFYPENLCTPLLESRSKTFHPSPQLFPKAAEGRDESPCGQWLSKHKALYTTVRLRRGES